MLDWDEPRRRFVDDLRQHGVGVKVIWITENEEAQPDEADLQVITPAMFAQGGIDAL